MKSKESATARRSRLRVWLVVAGLLFPLLCVSSDRPGLLLTEDGVRIIRSQLGSVPLFDASLAAVKREVDREIAAGIETPIPKDFSGGYTHQRHKQNFFAAQKAGVLYQILQDAKYAIYVRDMLFQYESLYKTLPLHPQERSYARGRLFWQCLNDSNWLVYMSQAYDTIYDFLSEAERTRLEENLFRPFADFLSIENPQFFNRVHNHSTWGNAAVGMIGLVMDDQELIERALYGVNDDALDSSARDNDGGFIRVEGQRAGFLANVDAPFSPDGYYTEGPYYQRYAMYPFLVFAQGLNNLKPEVAILRHKDGVLLKAVDALLMLADADGEFFPLNDGQKGMSYDARELVTAVNIAYHLGGRNPQLLSLARQQGRVLLDDTGIAVAMAVRDGKAEPFRKSSVNLSDGPEGRQGGVAVLRQGDEDLTLVFKYSAQGLSHGHYDKLSYSLYERGTEILQDYGLVRFVNIGQKGGGNYLPENASWAKQTIAHNTVIQNETSHFGGAYEIGSQHHSVLHFYDASDPGIQIVSATDENAYPGTKMHRTVALIGDETLDRAYLLDVFRITASASNRYDLPFYFAGQVISTNFAFSTPSTLQPLGADHGYQHLYLEGQGQALSGSSQMTWLNQGRFYTLTTATLPNDTLLFTRIGANDPSFNLRRDPGFMVRRDEAGGTVFASLVESHGSYSPVSELALNATSDVKDLAVTIYNEAYTVVTIRKTDGPSSMLIIANADASGDTDHQLEVDGRLVQWSGPYKFFPRVERGR